MKIKTEYQDKVMDFIKRLNDVRFVGQLLFVAVVLMISWSGVKTIQTNYGLQKEITALNHKNTLQKMENENLALKNGYYHSKQYLELAARQNFGLGAPGEKLVIVPEEVAMANTIEMPVAKESKAEAQKPVYQRNFQSWVDFFLHRQAAN